VPLPTDDAPEARCRDRSVSRSQTDGNGNPTQEESIYTAGSRQKSGDGCVVEGFSFLSSGHFSRCVTSPQKVLGYLQWWNIGATLLEIDATMPRGAPMYLDWRGSV